MNTPNGFTYTVRGEECIIDHVRTGMGCLNLFLGVWLTGWTFGCAFLVRGYVTGGKMENGTPIPLWFVMAFVVPWFIVAYLLLYSLFARKRFRLSADDLQIETRLLLLHWSVVIRRETITAILQVKDGGEGDDSFPSWGLDIRSTALPDSFLKRLISFNHFGRSFREERILARLPYDHSEWLAGILSQWSGVSATMCPKPESEQGHASGSQR